MMAAATRRPEGALQGELALTTAERRSLAHFEAVIDELMDLDETMPIGRVKVILALLRAEGEPLTGDEIAEQTHLDQTNIVRHLQALGPTNRYGTAGYDLIESEVDASNRRRILRRWSPAGRGFVRRFFELLSGR